MIIFWTQQECSLTSDWESLSLEKLRNHEIMIVIKKLKLKLNIYSKALNLTADLTPNMGHKHKYNTQNYILHRLDSIKLVTYNTLTDL